MQLDLDIGGRTRRVAVAREEAPPRPDGAVANAERFLVTMDGRRWVVDASRVDPHTLSLLIDEGGRRRSSEAVVAPGGAGGGLTVHVGTAAVAVGVNGPRRKSRKDGDGPAQAGPLEVRASMPGRVVRVLVERGDVVKAGQSVVVIEAMKMENELRAGRDGSVADVRAREGMSVEAGTLLVVIA